jgi:hypothetical protein
VKNVFIQYFFQRYTFHHGADYNKLLLTPRGSQWTGWDGWGLILSNLKKNQVNKFVFFFSDR